MIKRSRRGKTARSLVRKAQANRRQYFWSHGPSKPTMCQFLDLPKIKPYLGEVRNYPIQSIISEFRNSADMFFAGSMCKDWYAPAGEEHPVSLSACNVPFSELKHPRTITRHPPLTEEQRLYVQEEILADYGMRKGDFNQLYAPAPTPTSPLTLDFHEDADHSARSWHELVKKWVELLPNKPEPLRVSDLDPDCLVYKVAASHFKNLKDLVITDIRPNATGADVDVTFTPEDTVKGIDIYSKIPKSESSPAPDWSYSVDGIKTEPYSLAIPKDI